ETGRRLHVIGAGGLRDGAGRYLLVVGEQRRLDDHLAQRAAVAARPGHRLDVAFDDAQVAGFERADIDDHVDLSRAVEDRTTRLVALDVSRRRAEWKPDNGTHAHAAA